MSDIRSIVTELHNALQHQQLGAANNLLSRAKISLLQQNALIPTQSTQPQLFSLAREVLELGALASIRQQDAQTFTRYYQQLQPFYDVERHGEENPSASRVDVRNSQRSKITGLYLLLLLSMGDGTGFHTVLEGLVEEAMLKGRNIEDDAFIKYPVELERNLMEGSYDKVWAETKSERVPSEDFGLFSSVSSLYLSSSAVYLFIDNTERSLLGQSAAKSPIARRRRIHRFPFPTLRIFSSSSLKVLLSNLPNSVVGFSVTDEYTSLLNRRVRHVPRRTCSWPAAPSLRTR